MHFCARRPDPFTGVKLASRRFSGSRREEERSQHLLLLSLALHPHIVWQFGQRARSVLSRCTFTFLHRRMNGNDGSESSDSGGPGVFVPV